MVIWLNGAFGSGKTTTAFELHRRLPGSFVYDPENIGYFLLKNTPKEIRGYTDFQDEPLWREFNRNLLGKIANDFGGTVIVPMTVTNPAYYGEIVEGLAGSAVLKHFVLGVDGAELYRRLKKRLSGKNSWAAKQIDRCVNAFKDPFFENYIDTNNMPVQKVAEKVAEMAGIELAPETRGPAGKWLARQMVLIRHIRR